jgi:hypothetical protein
VVDFELPSPGLSIDEIKRMMAASAAAISVSLDEHLSSRSMVVESPPGDDAVWFVAAPVVPVSLASGWSVFDNFAAETTAAKVCIVMRESRLPVRRTSSRAV